MTADNTQALKAIKFEAQLGAEIDCDQYYDYLTRSTAVSRIDLGSSMISKLQHPDLGAIFLVSTDGGRLAMFQH